MNLHSIVRGAISTVNPDRAITWQVSTGNTIDAAGKQTPTYATPVTIPRAQIQPVAGDDLQHIEKLNQQATYRTVYAFGNIAGIVRPEMKGGDLLTFPQVIGGADFDWLVVHVVETWTPDAAGWCHVIVALQE